MKALANGVVVALALCTAGALVLLVGAKEEENRLWEEMELRNRLREGRDRAVEFIRTHPDSANVGLAKLVAATNDIVYRALPEEKK